MKYLVLQNLSFDGSMYYEGDILTTDKSVLGLIERRLIKSVVDEPVLVADAFTKVLDAAIKDAKVDEHTEIVKPTKTRKTQTVALDNLVSNIDKTRKRKNTE